MMTFAELMVQCNAEIFPDGLADNVAVGVRSFYKEAIVEMQRWIKCLQSNHTDIIPFKAAFWRCGTSVFCAPSGQIQRLYTVGAAFCNPVDYYQVDYETIRLWSRRFAGMSGTPPNTGLPPLQIGFKYPEIVTDGSYGRAVRGWFAYDKGNIVVAPWIQSTESIAVEWDGMKRSFADEDLVGPGKMNDVTWLQAIKAYVMWRKLSIYDHEASFSQDRLAEFNDCKANLRMDCRKITENLVYTQRNLDDIGPVLTENCQVAAALAAATGSTTPGTVTPTIFALIGDYGLAGADELAVAQLVKGWQGSYIVTAGDNNYQDGSALTIDANVGRYYRNQIYPYKGSEPLWAGEEDATANKFWPSLGNHDLDAGFPPTPYLDYFTLPNNGRYYSFIDGFVEWFVIDSGLNTAGTLVETAGVSSVDFQAAWLQARLAASIARFKAVVWHHPGITSAATYWPGIPQLVSLMGKLKEWGADVLFNGHAHNYERLDVDGLPVLINGAGGNALVGFHDPPVDESVIRYNAMFGAIKGSVTCDLMTLQFINTNGVVVDTFEINKALT